MAADPSRCAAGRFRFFYDYVEITPGNRFEWVPDGELVGLVVIVGLESGFVRVSAGRDAEELLLWDEYCLYDRVSTGILERRLPAGEVVTLEPTDADVDYSSAVRPVEAPEEIRKRLKLVGWMVRE